MCAMKVRTKIKLPSGYGSEISVPQNKDLSKNLNPSVKGTYKPPISITLYKTKGGRYLAKTKGVGLTKVEKSHGYKITRGKTADFIKSILSQDPNAEIRKVGAKNTRLQKWIVGNETHLFDVRTGTVHVYNPQSPKARYHDPVRAILDDIGNSTYGGGLGVHALSEEYTKLTSKQQLKFIALFNDNFSSINSFFAEFVDSDGTGHSKHDRTLEVDLNHQKEGYDLVKMLLSEARE